MADPTSKQRLTKAERKEEARRQRVELQRKMAKTAGTAGSRWASWWPWSWASARTR